MPEPIKTAWKKSKKSILKFRQYYELKREEGPNRASTFLEPAMS